MNALSKWKKSMELKLKVEIEIKTTVPYNPVVPPFYGLHLKYLPKRVCTQVGSWEVTSSQV